MRARVTERTKGCLKLERLEPAFPLSSQHWINYPLNDTIAVLTCRMFHSAPPRALPTNSHCYPGFIWKARCGLAKTRPQHPVLAPVTLAYFPPPHAVLWRTVDSTKIDRFLISHAIGISTVTLHPWSSVFCDLTQAECCELQSKRPPCCSNSDQIEVNDMVRSPFKPNFAENRTPKSNIYERDARCKNSYFRHTRFYSKQRLLS
jgi:hypothetical protein